MVHASGGLHRDAERPARLGSSAGAGVVWS